MLDRWLELYLAVTERNGHDARIGPALLGLAHAAGFDDVTVSSTTWTYADPEARAWWGGLWADRVRYSRFAEQAVEYGLSDAEELEAIARRSCAGPPRPTASSSSPTWRSWPATDPGTQPLRTAVDSRASRCTSFATEACDVLERRASLRTLVETGRLVGPRVV